MQESQKDTSDIDEVIVALIAFNAKLRNEIISTYPITAKQLITDELLEKIMIFLDSTEMSSTDKLDIILRDNPEIFNNIFSKGYDRLATFRALFTSGIISSPFGETTHKSWKTFSKEQQWAYAAVVLVVVQVFGDGNHRTSGKLVQMLFPLITAHQSTQFWELTEDIHRTIGADYPYCAMRVDVWTGVIIRDV